MMMVLLIFTEKINNKINNLNEIKYNKYFLIFYTKK